jgi:hypothetical protein
VARLRRFPCVALCAALWVATSRFALAQGASVVDLQPYESGAITGSAERGLSLINLNPGVGMWYLLERRVGYHADTLHLEVLDPATTKLDIQGDRLVEIRPWGNSTCTIWAGDDPLFRPSDRPFTAACTNAVAVRHRHAGSRSTTEAATDFLRDSASGEYLINFYKDHLLDTGETADLASGAAAQRQDGSPAPARLMPGYQNRVMSGAQIGLSAGATQNTAIGIWTPADGAPGVWSSLITPAAAQGLPANDATESANIVYLMAIDLTNTAIRYHVGTLHPGVQWSSRPKVAHVGAGPDGIETVDPIVRLGQVPPWERDQLLATFSGGFKREHGAFKTMPYTLIENGMHYGFVEDGTVLSTLKPGLVTLYGLTDGTVGLKSWSAEDRGLMPRLVFARQNGLALVEHGQPGPEVENINGNWSGSNEGHLVTLRSGVCLARAGKRGFLIYGLFTSATPSTMARVFTAYGCDAAMHLDMNSLALTYAAAYRHDADGLAALTLHRGMDQGSALKFVDQPDSRDFFEIIRKAPSTQAQQAAPGRLGLN